MHGLSMTATRARALARIDSESIRKAVERLVKKKRTSQTGCMLNINFQTETKRIIELIVDTTPGVEYSQNERSFYIQQINPQGERTKCFDRELAQRLTFNMIDWTCEKYIAEQFKQQIRGELEKEEKVKDLYKANTITQNTSKLPGIFGVFPVLS